MTWLRLDDDFYDHEKVGDLDPAAGWLWVRALGWTAKHLRDGFVPSHVVVQFAGSIEAAQHLAGLLVQARLWDATPGGWSAHDFTDYNPSAEQVRAKRAAAQARMATRRAQGGSVRANKDDSSREQHANVRENNTRTDDERSREQHANNTRTDDERSREPAREPAGDGARGESVCSLPPSRPDPSREERERESAPAPEGEPRCGTEERPNAPSPDQIEAALVRGGGRKLDLRAAAGIKVHLRRAFVELGYPLPAWEALGRQVGEKPEALWPSEYMRGLLARSGGKVTVPFLLGRKLDNAPASACGYDCAPLTEAFGRLAQLRTQTTQGGEPARSLPPSAPPVSEAGRATVSAIAARFRAPAEEAHRG